MQSKFEHHLQGTNSKARLTAPSDFIIKEIHDEFTYAYVNHVSSSVASSNNAANNSSIKRDYSLMICYDHRINNDFN